jgi:hypothetical protein
VLALLIRSFGQRAMKGRDTFTVPRRAQAAGRIYPQERWRAEGSLSITRRVTVGALGQPLAQ